MKNLKIGVILLILLLSSTAVFAIPNPSNEFYVYDEVNIMNGNTENYIIRTNDELYRKTGAQIVIAAIDDLEGMDINNYATALFEKWGIGGSELDNGLLMLIVPSEGELWIEVGYGLEGAIPDARASRQIIEEYIIPSFAEGDYNQGIILGFNEILSYVQEEYNIELSSMEDIENPYPSANSGSRNSIPSPLIIIGIIIFVFIDIKFFRGWLTFSILRNMGRGGRGGRGGGGRGGGGGRSGGGGAGGRW